MNETRFFPIKTWLITSYTLISIVGVLGNSLVLIVLIKGPHLQKAMVNVYIMSLAISDLCAAILCLPVYITSTSNFKAHPTGTGGDIMCKILSGYNVLFILAFVSVYTRVAIALERYYAICKPISYRKILNKNRAVKVIMMIWILSLLLNLDTFVGELYVDKNGFVGAHCTFFINYKIKNAQSAVFFISFCVRYVFPAFFITFSCIAIRRKLQSQGTRMVRGKIMGVEHLTQKIKANKQRRTFITFLYVIMAYYILWTPNQIIYICFNFKLFQTSWESWNENYVQVTVIMCFFTCCVNPVIYPFRSKQFRNVCIRSGVFMTKKRQKSPIVFPTNMCLRPR